LIKTILFDVDGVLATGEPFSAYLAREHGITKEMTAAFFAGPFLECLVGRADLKQAIAGYLPQWGWRWSLEEFIGRWFDYEHQVNEPLIEVIQRLRRQGIPCYLATNQEKYRTAYILNEMGFADKSDGIFSSAHIGYMKHHPAFFEAVLQQLADIQAKDVLFWDDSPVNIATAREVGMQAELYQNFTDFMQKLHLVLKQSL